MTEEKPLQSFANIDVYTDYALVKVNSKIFPLSIVISAAYDLMDRGYFVINGDPEKEMFVEVRLNKNSDKNLSLLELAKEFNNQMINYAFYEIQSARTKDVREIITRAALFGEPPEQTQESCEDEYRGDEGYSEPNEDVCEPEPEYDEEDVDEIVDSFEFDDPEGIAVPWDQKYGTKEEWKYD